MSIVGFKLEAVVCSTEAFWFVFFLWEELLQELLSVRYE